METQKIIGLAVVLLFAGGVGYFFLTSESLPPGEIPDYVTGQDRVVYEWAGSEPGWSVLEQIPCYCGCKYEGHLHARHCYSRDDGTFDKHGLTCSVCFDIASKTKQMYEEGKNVCEIRYEIDKFYAANKNLATPTPLPEGCTAYEPIGNEPAVPQGCGNTSGSEGECSLT